MALFSDVFRVRALRNPAFYAHNEASDDFWKLRILFMENPPHVDPFHDPLLGHRKPSIEPRTYKHAKDGEINGRIPVLLYGDSFANCGDLPREKSLEGILNSDPRFNERHFLVDYAVGAHGLDQTLLLYENTVGRYSRPIVLMAPLDHDIDRSILTLRERCKPHFGFRDGALELRGVPPEPDPVAYVNQHPPEICFYLGRLVLKGLFNFDWNTLSNRARKEKVGTAILDRMAQDLKRRQLRHLFLVFEVTENARRKPTWRRNLIQGVLQRHGSQHVFTSDLLRSHAPMKGFDPLQYQVSRTDLHPNETYVRLVAEHILRWILEEERRRNPGA